MAQSKKSKKTPAKPKGAKRPAAVKSKKAAPARKAPAKKVTKRPAVKPKAKPVKSAKGATKSKAAAKAKPKAAAKRVTAKAAPARPARKSSASAPAKTRRAVAASHRIQKGAVAVQPAAAARSTAAAPPARPRAAPSLLNGRPMTESEIRRAPESDYMSEDQMTFFRERLMQMRNEVLARELDVKERLHQREVFADPADRASAEEEHWLDLRLRERESLLLRKIDEALRRIRDREYGYCEKTGEPIGIARLLARPTATVCVDIKGQDERAESQYRDR